MTTNYAASHQTLMISAKRFEASPYTDKYATADTVYGIYCNRFYPLSLGQDPVEHYWKLRRGVLLYDVPEKPLEIRGPDALALLERILARPIASLKTWRARYAIACTPQGGIVMDGIVIRLAEDHFWYVQADGEFELWLAAYAEGLDVTVSDPSSRVLQIQGPKSLEVLKAASGSDIDEFGYFHAREFNLGGQTLLVSRTGWTGELGFEVYSQGGITDHGALWDHLMASGAPLGMTYSSAESMGIRRIEAGILDNGTDIDPAMTPFEAGLGDFIDLNKPDYVGRAALQQAKRGTLLHGLTCKTALPFAKLEVLVGTDVVGRMTAGAWSPYLDCGVGFVRFHSHGDWLGRRLTLRGRDGRDHDCQVVALPFYDPEKKIPRGLTTDLS